MAHYSRLISRLGAIVFVVLCLGSCSPSDSDTSAKPRDEVVVDQFLTLKDGETNAFKLVPGLYRAEMTASGDGAQVEWLGGDCPKSSESKTYSSVCELRQDGQIVVTNPTSFGMGAGSTITLKVTRLAR